MTEALRRALERMGVRTDTGRDAVLGAVVAVVTVALYLVVERVVASEAGAPFGAGPGTEIVTPAQRAVILAVLVAQSMALALRRRAPLTCLALSVVGQVAVVALLPPYVGFQAPATLVAAYSVGAYAHRGTRLWAAGGAAVVQVLLVFALGGLDPTGAGPAQAALQVGSAFVSALLTYVGAALVGSYVVTRRELVAELHDRVRRAEREREVLAAQAVLEERSRMARELHDVAAHHLSGIVVQAAAAERLVDADPARAKESVRWIRAQGKDTLDDLRLVVGILRSTDDEGRGDRREDPQPTLADVPALVDTARAAGSTVTVETTGDPWKPAPSTEIAVFRVLQEALANARRHAPGRPVAVRLAWASADLTVTVRNPSAGTVPRDVDETRPGHGLVGMRERAAMLGGSLDARRAPDGAWLVRLVVPRVPGRDRRDSEAEAVTGQDAPGDERAAVERSTVEKSAQDEEVA